jgi:hypothetical protein
MAPRILESLEGPASVEAILYQHSLCPEELKQEEIAPVAEEPEEAS